MSFAGALPPIWCDGNLLVDGCYTNNVPGTDLREMQWLNYFSKKLFRADIFAKTSVLFSGFVFFVLFLFLFIRKWGNYVSLFSLVGEFSEFEIYPENTGKYIKFFP